MGDSDSQDEPVTEVFSNDGFKYKLMKFLNSWTFNSTQMASIEKAMVVIIDRKFQNLKTELSTDISMARQANGERMGLIEDRLAKCETDLKLETQKILTDMKLADNGFKQNFETISSMVRYFILPVAVLCCFGALSWVIKSISESNP